MQDDARVGTPLANGSGSVPMAQAPAATNGGPPEKISEARVQLATPGSPSASSKWGGHHLTSHEGITGDVSGVKNVQNPYHMHEVHFVGIRGNPVVVALSLIITWSVVLAAVLEPTSFFDNAADAKR